MLQSGEYKLAHMSVALVNMKCGKWRSFQTIGREMHYQRGLVMPDPYPYLGVMWLMKPLPFQASILGGLFPSFPLIPVSLPNE